MAGVNVVSLSRGAHVQVCKIPSQIPGTGLTKCLMDFCGIAVPFLSFCMSFPFKGYIMET